MLNNQDHPFTRKIKLSQIISLSYHSRGLPQKVVLKEIPSL